MAVVPKVQAGHCLSEPQMAWMEARLCFLTQELDDRCDPVDFLHAKRENHTQLALWVYQWRFVGDEKGAAIRAARWGRGARAWFAVVAGAEWVGFEAGF